MDGKIQTAVTDICEQGCVFVREAIALLAAGKDPLPAQSFGEQERAAILEELKTIMAVYDARE